MGFFSKLFPRRAPVSTKSRSRRSARPRVELLEARELLDGTALFLDFGTWESPVEDGFLQVPPIQYDPAVGYGWWQLDGIWDYDLGQVNAVTTDGHAGQLGTFFVDVPNGMYQVVAYVGHAWYPLDYQAVYVNGARIASGVSSAPDEYVPVTAHVLVTDGYVEFWFGDEGGQTDFFSIVCLAIVPDENPPDPSAFAGPDLIVAEGELVGFAGTVSGLVPMSYTWNFGDGNFASETLYPIHVFADDGIYAVELTVTDLWGRSSSSTAWVTVTNADASAVLDSVLTVDEGGVFIVSFISPLDSLPIDEAAGYRYSYDLNNDGIFEFDSIASSSIAHSYADNGAYTFRARIIDSDGGFTDHTRDVEVWNLPPTATLFPVLGRIGTGVSFSALIHDSQMDQLFGFSYLWTFGDGQSSMLPSPNYAYASQGVFTVTLTVWDKDGDWTTVETTATISPPLTVGDYVVTPNDTIRNFGASPTISSIRDGNWSDPSTWSLGRVPADGDIVAIATNTTITYDVQSNVRVNTVAIDPGGRLHFRTDINTRLMVANLLVLETGELRIGTAAAPVAADVTAEIIFLNEALDTLADPDQWGNGLIALGTVTMHGRAQSSTFQRLGAEPRAGDTTIYLAEPVTGWAVGDKLILPDSHQLDWFEQHTFGGNYVPQWEVRTITAISADGLRITLNSALQYDHKGARNGDGLLEFLPHVGNLSRNVVLRSENGAGVRGHTLFTHHANVDIRYVSFDSLGRTTNDEFNDTTFNALGLPTHIGTNQSGRYPVSFRHLIGSASTPENGYQFTFVGNAVTCMLDQMRFRWGIDVKNSHYGLIAGNVVYNWAGAGLAVEDGNESFNVIEGNFVVRVTGTGDREKLGTEGNAYWFRGPNNIVRDNVAANAYGGLYSYGYVIYAYRVGGVRVPSFRGADVSIQGQFTVVDMNGTPVREFARNEVYGATPNGFAMWWIGTSFQTPQGNAGTVYDFRAWHVYAWGYFGYESNNLTIDGMVVRGDTTLDPANRTAAGMWFGDYFQKGLRITNADIQGTRIGIETPYFSDGETIIDNSYIRAQFGIWVGTMWTVAGGGLPPKIITISNSHSAPSFEGFQGVRRDAKQHE